MGTGMMTILGVVLYGCTALLPLFLQTILGYPALQSGLTVSPRGFGSIFGMLLVGRLLGIIDGLQAHHHWILHSRLFHRFARRAESGRRLSAM